MSWVVLTSHVSHGGPHDCIPSWYVVNDFHHETKEEAERSLREMQKFDRENNFDCLVRMVIEV